MTTRANTLGILAMMATAFLWSTAGLFIKIIDWNPLTIAGCRSLIASLVILLFLRRPKFHLSFPQVAAALANAATMLLFVSANKTTTSANAILLQYTGPIFTAFIAAALIKERVRIEHWIAFPLVAAGMTAMFMDKLGGGRTLGNVLAVLSAMTFSFYFVFMRMQKDGSPLESILLSHWLVAAIGIVSSIFMPIPPISLKAIGAIAALGIFQVGIAAILFAAAIKRISAISANLIAMIEPVFNPLWVFFVLGEMPGPNAIIGGLIIIAAVTAASAVGANTGSNLQS